MSPINQVKIIGVFILAGILLYGCGSSTTNPQSSFNAGTAQHATGWQTSGHMTVAQTDKTSCPPCHGSDYSGGISKVSCAQCHLEPDVPAWNVYHESKHGDIYLSN